MSDYAKPEHHIVTVRATTEGGWLDLESVEFSCCAPEDAPCRTYPKCDCEIFTQDDDNPGHDQHGHAYVTGRDCWVASWFDAEPYGLSTIYVGTDQSDATDCGVPPISQHGHVSIVGFDDCGPEWEWFGMPVRDDEPTDPDPARAAVIHVPGQETFDFGVTS